jgi:RimJ/RimL family protein N-acetyltransferase
MEPETLHTTRLVLSTPTSADVDAIHTACQDADIQRYTTVPSPYLREHAEDFIGHAASGWESGVETTWAIREGETLAGMIGLARLHSGGPELGYWVARRARGRGIVTEASRAVIAWAFAPERPAVARIEWRAVVGNVASAHAARSAGFRYEGMLRQALRTPFGRADAWIAGLLRTDDRAAQPWAVLGD